MDLIDYEAAAERVLSAARNRESFGLTALAVHGIVEGSRDPALRYRLNHLDVVTADGQAVRWALNLLHGGHLAERCYGPTLMAVVCESAAEEALPVYLYGSTDSVLAPLARNLVSRYPDLKIAGMRPSVFGQVGSDKLDRIAADIRASGARVVFAGLGCPRQEVFAYEMRERLGLPVLAVGAAFDYHAGMLKAPPMVVQRAGLQWMWRLIAEPRRLFRRYATTNPAFVVAVARQRLGWRIVDPASATAPVEELGFA